jgi:predicted dehydrogenase
VKSDRPTRQARPPLRVVIVGAGAVVKEYQGPAAMEAQREGIIDVIGVVDRDPEQLRAVAKVMPSVLTTTDLAIAGQADLALVATPPPTHLSLGLRLVEDYDCHLLVEKPMAVTASDARALQAIGRGADKLVAVGHFRRFFPALETLADLIAQKTFGSVRRVVAEEGGLFRWPASAAFFTPETAGGGVTLDIGVHMFELLIAWLGVPEVIDYQDDAMGGVEINSRAQLEWPDGVTCSLRLSWDVPLANTYTVEFDRARVTWRTGQATTLLLELDGVTGVQTLVPRQRIGRHPEHTLESAGYLGSFTRQWRDVVEAVQGRHAPRVSDSASAAVALVERMYSVRRLIEMPYLDADERLRAEHLAAHGGIR